MCLWTRIGRSKCLNWPTYLRTQLNSLTLCFMFPDLFCFCSTTKNNNSNLYCPYPPNRSELSLQPVIESTDDSQGEQYDCSEGFSYEDVNNLEPEKRLQQICRRRGNQGGVMTINIVPLKDAVTCKETGDVGENFDVPFVLHLWPSILLRNLLPYTITYSLKVGCM